MAYTDQMNQAVREMTPNEQLAQAAGRLAAVSSELSEHGGMVNAKRNELHQMEGNLARSQVEFDDAVRSFRALLDQYGLTMDVPMPEKRF
jgi:hypothetical protein